MFRKLFLPPRVLETSQCQPGAVYPQQTSRQLRCRSSVGMQQGSAHRISRVLHRSAKFRWPVFFGVVALVSCIVGFRGCSLAFMRPDPANAPDAKTVSIDINLAAGHPISETLFGIFFEEINHAGEGGLYAEMVQDRSFDALALTQRFKPSAGLGTIAHNIPHSAFSQPSYGRPLNLSSRPKVRGSWNVSSLPDG